MLILTASQQGTSQDVRLTNPSFEDRPRQGIFDARTGQRSQQIKGWRDCGAILFPQATPPDIHDGKSNYWKTEVVASHGKTYMTIVVRDNDSYETVSQRLLGTLKVDKCYSFTINLTKSKTYLSPTKDSRGVNRSFTQPAVLRIYGGNSTCDTQELLAESRPVDNTSWETYEFLITPNGNYTHLTLEAYFVTPTIVGYNGHICVDNASNFREVDCNDPTRLVAEASKKKKPVPSFKRKQKKKVEDKLAINLNKKEEKVDTIVYKRPKKKLIEDLDIRSLTIGQLIQLPHLYFEADTSAINDNSYQTLNELYSFLDKYEEVNIEVGGHTNNAPPDEYCDKLSTERAEAVAKYLISKGIESDRISHKGYGKRRPIATNATAAGRKKNQRVQIKITSLG